MCTYLHNKPIFLDLMIVTFVEKTKLYFVKVAYFVLRSFFSVRIVYHTTQKNESRLIRLHIIYEKCAHATNLT